MQPYLPQVRADRLIAVSRMALAVFALVAVQVDRDLRVSSRHVTEVLAFYAIYAVLLAIVSFRFNVSSQALRLTFLVVDFAIYSVIVAVSRGAASPFFVFFVFAILCAALRFGVRGSLLMTAAAALVYGFFAVWLHNFRQDPGFVILRLTYIAILGMLLTYFAAFLERTTEELQRIAVWPRTPAAQLDDLLSQSVTDAAALLRAPHVVILCEDPDEPWMTLAEIRDGAVDVRGLPPEAEPTFDLPHIITTRIRGALAAGSITFAGPQPWSEDDKNIAEIVGRLIAGQLDQHLMQDAARRTAVGEERLRLGRDLHDGLLQSLTGIALGIETVAQQTNDAALAAQLRSLQEVISADQHDLRAFVSQLRPGRSTVADAPLGERLRALGRRIAMQWNIDVEIAVIPDAPALPSAIVSEVYALVGEALANAAKHAGATRVGAHVRLGDDELHIEVEDNGHGFPFSGTYDLAALDAEQRGPVTLKERIISLGGDLTLSSSPAGSRLEMRIDV